MCTWFMAYGTRYAVCGMRYAYGIRSGTLCLAPGKQCAGEWKWRMAYGARHVAHDGWCMICGT
eukprot:9576001-Lingulodinium_polyedra.AAC.1